MSKNSESQSLVAPHIPYENYMKLTCENCETTHALVLRTEPLPEIMSCSVCHQKIILKKYSERKYRRDIVNKKVTLFDYITKLKYPGNMKDFSPYGAKICTEYHIKAHQIIQVLADEFTAIAEARWVKKVKKKEYDIGLMFHEFIIMRSAAVLNQKT